MSSNPVNPNSKAPGYAFVPSGPQAANLAQVPDGMIFCLLGAVALLLGRK